MSVLDSKQASQSAESRARLVRTAGPGTGSEFILAKDSIAIGRTYENNDLVLDDDEISRSHAHLTRLPDGRWQLEDHSSNGSYVYGVRVEKVVLDHEAIIAFGSGTLSSFRFEDRQQGLAAKSVKTVKMGDDRQESLPTRLQLVLDTHAVRDIPLSKGTMVLGRFPGAGGVTIDSPLIADRHASLDVGAQGAVTVRDLGTPSGTFVNGVRVTEKRLEEGDMLQLGACETHLLLFRDAGARRRTLGEFDLKKTVVRIGRATDNDVVLSHPTVSSHHAEIRRQASGEMELVDLGSANGTFVNGRRVERAVLAARDRIALGAMELAFDGLQLEREADGKRISVFAEVLRKEVKDQDGRTIVLLDDVSIVLKPNEFVGLLGPSGAGKSTLMDAMNGFRPVDGSVRMNDRSLYQYPKMLRELIGYLPQDDIMHTQLTVRQCLAFSARLRMPSDYSDAEIDEQVKKVLETLRLTERAEKAISSLSGGQRKRASLGIELLSDPAVLYVDEPTAGQDPATEMQMMQLFRNLANRGSTVVINTHLLGSFSLLDKVAVLARGKLVYFGPATEMLAYFGCKRPIEVYYKLAPPGMGRPDEERIADEWKKKYLASSVYAEHVKRPLDESHLKDHKGGKDEGKDHEEGQQVTTATQVKTLLARQFTLRASSLSSVLTLLLPPALIGVLLCFMADGPNQPMTLLMMILVAMWFSCSGSVREIVDEWAIYRRERQRSLRLASYLTSKLLYLVALSGAQTLLFVAILTVGGALSNHFFGAWGLMWLMGIQGGLIGLLISALSKSSEGALYTFPLVMIMELLLAGLLIPVHAVATTTPVASVPGLVVQLAGGETRHMNAFLGNGLSVAMVSRWGLEAMSELYVHDAQALALPAQLLPAGGAGAGAGPPATLVSGYDYRYPLLSSIWSTFHPNDMQVALLEIPKLKGEEGCRYEFFGSRNLGSSNALPQYMGIQGAFMLVMIGGIWMAVRRREEKS